MRSTIYIPCSLSNWPEPGIPSEGMACFVQHMGNSTDGITKYKIFLLVFKCINNLAPSYLSELVNLRDTKRHSLRVDNDFSAQLVIVIIQGLP